MDSYELCPDRNVLTVFDKLSNREIDLYYDMPDNAMRIQFSNAMSKRRGGKIVIPKNILEIQASFGRKLLTGFGKGAFTVKGKVIASEPEDEAYYPDWKKLVGTARGDLCAKLAQVVFGAVDLPDMGVEFEAIEDLEDPAFTFEDDAATTPATQEAAATASPLSGQ